MLTVSQKNSLVVKLQMLLRDEASIVVRNLRSEPHTDRAVLVFYVEKKGGKLTMPGPEVVKRLKEKLRQDSGLLQLSVANIDTAVCQNNCSGKFSFMVQCTRSSCSNVLSRRTWSMRSRNTIMHVRSVLDAELNTKVFWQR